MDSKDSLSNKHLVAIIAIVAIAVVGIVGLVLGMFGISKNNMILSKDLAGQAVIPVTSSQIPSAPVTQNQNWVTLPPAPSAPTENLISGKLEGLTIQLLQAGDSLARVRGTVLPDAESGGSILDQETNNFEETIGVPDDDTEDPGAEIVQNQNVANSQALVSQLVEIANKRQSLMQQALEKDDASSVLKIALPKKMRNRLPPEVQQYLETEVMVSGELSFMHEDKVDSAGKLTESKYFFSLAQSDGTTLDIHFAASAPGPSNSLQGATVRAQGVKIGNALVLANSDTSLQVVAAAALSQKLGSGPQKIGVIIVNYQDDPANPYTNQAEVRDLMFANSQTSVANYIKEASYGKTWLVGDVYGPYTIALNSGGCDWSTIGNLAKKAAIHEAGSGKIGSYNALIYVFPESPSCFWAGLTNLKVSWINGKPYPGVVSHEMGHQYGLYAHSHSLVCSGGAIVCPIIQSPNIACGLNCVEYGDLFDIIGWGFPNMHYNSIRKDELNWLGKGSGNAPITTVTTSGNYPIEPYEPIGSDPKALAVKTPAGDWYYIEYRQPIGYDENINSNENVKNGVLVHLYHGYNSYLLNANPARRDWTYPALEVGKTFFDSASNIKITTISTSPSGATVSVSLDGTPPPCIHANPTISISPLSAFGKPGDTLSYNVKVTNQDTAACSSSTFNVAGSELPTNWQSTSQNLNLAPGTTQIATITVTSLISSVPGQYDFRMGATNALFPDFKTLSTVSYVVQPVIITQTDFSDDFNRPDSDSLGTKWNEVRGDLKINSNNLINREDLRKLSIAIANEFSAANVSAEATFTPTNSESLPSFGIILRYQDSKNYYLFQLRKRTDNSILRIVKMVKGGPVILKRVVISPPADTVPLNLKATAQGSSLAIYLNNEKKAEVNDGKFASGRVGIGLGSYANKIQKRKSQRADDFKAAVIT